jgi:beta-N-acetylhexosaminidase
MTAHVVIEALDRELPATLSSKTLPRLRDEIGFEGVLISDDLEMAAIADRFSISEAASKAVAAGCDLLLVCHRADRQREAVQGLCHWAEQSASHMDRLRQASEQVRLLAARLAPFVAKTFDPSALRQPEALAFAQHFAGEASRDPTEPSEPSGVA